MSFLQLNRWTIPTAKGGGRKPETIGDAGRAHDGGRMRDRRILKDGWRFMTTVQQELEADALHGVLLGLGQNFRFDADFYSGTGLAASSGTGLAFGPSAPGDGKDVVDESAAAIGKFGTGYAELAPTLTNVLPADSRDAENAPTGYTLISGATIGGNTDNYVQGSKSLRVDATGAGSGAETGTGIAAATVTYAGSVYVYAASAFSVTVQLFDNIGAIGAGQAVTLAAGKWNRIEVSGATAIGASSIKLRVTKTAAGADTFYCDAFQVVRAAVSGAWADGVRSQDLEYPTSIVSTAKALTIAAWVNGATANPGADAVLFHLAPDADGNNQIKVLRRSGNNEIRVEIVTEDGSTDNATYATSPWDGTWKHLVISYRPHDDDDEGDLKVYLTGAQVAAMQGFAPIDLSRVANFYVGHDAGADNWGQEWEGIDELRVLPYAVPLALAGAWSGLTAQMPDLPAALADGDFIQGVSVEVEGEIGDIEYMGKLDSGGTWRGQARRTSFQLFEA